jgi:hypothetical protein
MSDEPKATSTPVIMSDLVPQSSVEISDRAKGPPAVTVKAYAPSIWVAADLALKTYAFTKHRLREESDEQEDD